jgi:ArsR family transcriptional regulator, arsenate/arsenite/antimonite-responsive transcriptional repressor
MSKEQDVVGLFQQAQPFFIALGDKNRQQIIARLLQTYKLSVNEITKITPLSRPAVSHHLKILRDAGLVAVERNGTQRYYHIDEAAVSQIDLLERLVVALRNCTNWQDSKSK